MASAETETVFKQEQQQQQFLDPLFPEEEWYEQLLRYGLYLGAVFQIICILALIFDVSPKSQKKQQIDLRGQSSEESSSSADESEENEVVSHNNSRNNRRKLEKKKRK